MAGCRLAALLRILTGFGLLLACLRAALGWLLP